MGAREGISRGGTHQYRVLPVCPAHEVSPEKRLKLIAERPDILKKVEGEENLFRLSMTKSQNNPRFLLCAQAGQTLIVLHGFKEKSTADYERAIDVAARRRDKLQTK
jgi:phage-related protein